MHCEYVWDLQSLVSDQIPSLYARFEAAPASPGAPSSLRLHVSCVCRLTEKLLDVCKNPVFAGFNHNLFEAAAALVTATRSDAATLAALEERLLKAFDVVLGQDVLEFQPYVFQLLALLIDSAPQLRPEYVDVRVCSFAELVIHRLLARTFLFFILWCLIWVAGPRLFGTCGPRPSTCMPPSLLQPAPTCSSSWRSLLARRRDRCARLLLCCTVFRSF